MDNAFSNMPVSRGFSLRSLISRKKERYVLSREKEMESFFEAVKCAKQDLESIQGLLDSTADPDIIEYAIYQERAARLRLSYLIKKAKESKIKAANFIEL